MTNVYYLSYENVKPIFGIEIAEELLKKYAWVGINFNSLCMDLINYLPTNPPLTYNIRKENIYYERTTLSSQFQQQQNSQDIK